MTLSDQTMNGAALIMPGQGAQFEGMGQAWAEAFDVAKETWAEADEVLGFSLSAACWSSGDQVNRTDIAQPGIFTTSVAILRVLEKQGLDMSAAPFAAGLSLGEYTALWAAGVLTFADGLRLVRLRGSAMQDAADAIPSGMLSLMGASEEQAAALAAVGAKKGICQVANLNAPGQVILSGEFAGLEAAAEAAQEHGVRRTRKLVVAGGFHSECMRPAAERLKIALDEVPTQAARIPVLSNVTALPSTDPEILKLQLATQVCAPVLWERSMNWALGKGEGACQPPVETFLEPGPGTILAGIMRKIDGEAHVMSVATPADLQAPQA
ncbi:MAG: [acyl-carrier-protein] S-malonyltransferase [Glaciecola sp.]|jgi:[acyl-carrier-protein] S-malonyltransferase